MQGRQIPTVFRQFPTNRTPFFEKFVGGTNWVLIFVRQCPLFGGQGRQRAIKKVPQNIDFVGLVFLLSPFGFSFGDPLGGGTLYFLSLIISYLSCCLSFSPPISPRLNFFVLH